MDRRTDKTDRPTDRPTDRQKQTDRQTDRPTDRPTDKKLGPATAGPSCEASCMHAAGSVGITALRTYLVFDGLKTTEARRGQGRDRQTRKRQTEIERKERGQTRKRQTERDIQRE